jgi:hypothetical protein
VNHHLHHGGNGAFSSIDTHYISAWSVNGRRRGLLPNYTNSIGAQFTGCGGGCDGLAARAFCLLIYFGIGMHMHTLRGWGRLFIVGRQGSECACIRVWLLEQEARTHISDSLSDKSDVGRRAMNKAYNDKIIFSVRIFGANVGLLSKAPSCGVCV